MKGQLIFIGFLALCAFQVDASAISKSTDKVDLRLFVTNGAAIADNMFKAINSGLDKSKPNVETILNELAPEAKATIRKIIDYVRNKLKEEEDRVKVIFNTLNTALDKLKPIKSCSDKVSPAAKKLAWNTEKKIVKILQEVKEKYKSEIQGIKTEIKEIVNRTRTLFDTKVEAVVKCLTPGKKDANDCLNKEIEKIKREVLAIAFNVIILVQSANDSLSPALSDIIEQMLPVIETVKVDGKVLLKTLADCVATLK